MTTHEEAAHWFATLRRGVLTLEEHSAYETWVARRVNRLALAELEQIWSSLEHAQRRAPTPKLARKMILAALCAVSLGACIVAYSGNSAFLTHLDWINR